MARSLRLSLLRITCRFPSWVKSDGLAVGRSLPVYPYQQTSSDANGKSQKCRFCSLIPGLGVKLSNDHPCRAIVLSAVGVNPPHDGVR